METTIKLGVYIRIMEKKMQTTIVLGVIQGFYMFTVRGMMRTSIMMAAGCRVYRVWGE